jgi:hypothetical protein
MFKRNMANVHKKKAQGCSPWRKTKRSEGETDREDRYRKREKQKESGRNRDRIGETEKQRGRESRRETERAKTAAETEKTGTCTEIEMRQDRERDRETETTTRSIPAQSRPKKATGEQTAHFPPALVPLAEPCVSPVVGAGDWQASRSHCWSGSLMLSNSDMARLGYPHGPGRLHMPGRDLAHGQLWPGAVHIHHGWDAQVAHGSKPEQALWLCSGL